MNMDKDLNRNLNLFKKMKDKEGGKKKSKPKPKSTNRKVTRQEARKMTKQAKHLAQMERKKHREIINEEPDRDISPKVNRKVSPVSTSLSNEKKGLVRANEVSTDEKKVLNAAMIAQEEEEIEYLERKLGISKKKKGEDVVENSSSSSAACSWQKYDKYVKDLMANEGFDGEEIGE